MKKLLLVSLILSVVFTGCSESSEDKVPLNTATNTTNSDGTSVGPFNIVFDVNTKKYTHSVDVNIEQDQGALKYLINSPTTKDVELVSTAVTVQGCDAQKVIHQLFWLPENENLKLARKLKFGDHIYTAQNKTGAFWHTFENLNGCSKIRITTVLQEHAIVSRAGQRCDFGSGCVVLAECKQKFSDKTIDSLIAYRDDQGYTTVRKSLIDPAAGSDTPSTVFTASISNTNTNLTFNGNGLSFSIDKLTYDGEISYGHGMSDSYEYCNYIMN